MNGFKCLLMLTLSCTASAGEWTYNLLSQPDITSETGFWNIYLNDNIHAAEVPGLYGNGYFCVREEYHCVESEVLKFAVPRTGVLDTDQKWQFKDLSDHTVGTKNITIVGLELGAWIIHSQRNGSTYASYLYCNDRGLLAFTLMQDNSFHAGEFYLLTTTHGFAARSAE